MKAIIFDIDGTLIESMSVDTELYFDSIEKVLGPVTIRELSEYDHVTDTGILAQILEDNGRSISSATMASVKAVFVKRLRRYIENEGSFSIIDGAFQFFENTRKSDSVRVAIATGGWRESALLKLQSAGFNIDGIPLATCDDSPSRVEIMRSALEMAGNGVSSVTYFGDAEWDQRACRDLGWDFVAVGPGLGGIASYKNVEL